MDFAKYENKNNHYDFENAAYPLIFAYGDSKNR